MNCDEAFERLTSRGCDGDPGLERHLRRCRRCRDMQETLAPAMEWLTAPDGFDTPELTESAAGQPFLTDEALQVAERAAHRLGQNRTARPVRAASTSQRISWLAVAAMAAVCLFAVLLPISKPEQNRRSAVRSPAAAKCLWQARGEDREVRGGSPRQVVATCVACHMPTP
jgi:hypothetical protein